MIWWINEILQWICIVFLLYPKVRRFVIDFKEAKEEENG